ncbi:MAG: hypothetical protein CNCCGFBP_01820 [Fimbriimonadaceae bacterium]|nr:hypothetical protein [Fimbriimonadaceae bacterium]
MARDVSPCNPVGTSGALVSCRWAAGSGGGWGQRISVPFVREGRDSLRILRPCGGCRCGQHRERDPPPVAGGGIQTSRPVGPEVRVFDGERGRVWGAVRVRHGLPGMGPSSPRSPSPPEGRRGGLGPRLQRERAQFRACSARRKRATWDGPSSPRSPSPPEGRRGGLVP